jgi:hypothetical protein
MAFPLAFPTSPKPRSVRVTRQSVVGLTESPFSLKRQAVVWPGKRYSVEIVMPPMTTTQAGAWCQWLYDMNGREGTFTLDITGYCPTVSPAPGSTTFRLRDNTQGWDISTARHYGFTIVADQEV